MQTCQIRTTEDISQIPTEQPVRLEIYLNNCAIEAASFEGELRIRANRCAFPNLTVITGSLYIDGPDAQFPVLTNISGNCNIRSKNAFLPQLEQIGSGMALTVPVDLPALRFIHGPLRNPARIDVTRQLVVVERKWVIRQQSEVAFMPPDGHFSVEIKTLLAARCVADLHCRVYTNAGCKTKSPTGNPAGLLLLQNLVFIPNI